MNLFKTVETLRVKIDKLVNKPTNLMEVCGTHTNVISASGIRHILPKKLKLLSGPGCPVCVTAQTDIDWVIKLARTNKAIITTFGDLMRVPGSESSLEKEKAKGADIRVVYSPLDAVKHAQNNIKPVVFIGVGFETTIPTIAGTVIKAKEQKIKNFYVLPFFKLIPPALHKIVNSTEINVQGFILPGHVSAIIGSKPYEFLIKDYNKPCSITGFEPIDILQGIVLVLEQIKSNKPQVAIQYDRVVKKQGNIQAQNIMNQVFKNTDAVWRGLSIIKNSGLKFTQAYQDFNAKNHFAIKVSQPKETSCQCGEVLLGLIMPPECKLYARSCYPSNPIGPCMVSSEGACAAYYKYER